ncbi:glutathione S-transferase family protein [Rhizobium glycinendophyticum]|uniref:Glutathione S-transferase family protein n=1 Tax=Rhizobium glycinendophyticum TaxID=2589807 RepID=A0A504U834_9HYPH|nr:glutathione S-transferase family protein [Rhizobium glycinendophyticum]TPP11304.1 glutathione S-transferase family protein [Rhizobium glycinendophyticum]
MSDLHLYTHPMSRGRIARWMLEELGEPYETEIIAFGPQMKAEGYRRINPMGKVPAIRHGDTVVTECAAICAYLADAFPEAGLAPALNRRGDYYRWMFFAAGPLEAAVTNRSLNVEVPQERKGMVGYGSFETVMDTLEKALSGRQFVAGDRFSAADVYVGAHVGWGLQFGSIEKRPAFEAYFSALSARPAYQRARALDDAAVAELQKTTA